MYWVNNKNQKTKRLLRNFNWNFFVWNLFMYGIYIFYEITFLYIYKPFLQKLNSKSICLSSNKRIPQTTFKEETFKEKKKERKNHLCFILWNFKGWKVCFFPFFYIPPFMLLKNFIISLFSFKLPFPSSLHEI